MRQWSRFTMGMVILCASRFTASWRKTQDVHMVPTVSPEDMEETPVVDHMEDTIDIGSEGVANSVIEMSATEMRTLQKSCRKILPKESCLSTEERQRLTQMIFETHYASEGMDRQDRAMWYQSALEVQWLEKWARSEGRREKDVIHRAIKKAVLERVDLHKPLAYIIGYQPFYGCHIRCIPPLLCPRPETEMWTHWFVRHHLVPAVTMETTLPKSVTDERPLRVLDMCCGTGCVGIAIAVHVPHVEVVAVDILDEALKASEENAKLNGLCPGRYRVIKSDMFETFFASDSDTKDGEKYEKGKTRLDDSHIGSFDCIVSNPPYVLPEQYVNLPLGIKLWESKLALVGDEKREHQQYLYFQELCELGSALLKPKARRHAALLNTPNLVVEVGLQAERVASLFERSGMWEKVEVHPDYAQQMRWISACFSH